MMTRAMLGLYGEIWAARYFARLGYLIALAPRYHGDITITSPAGELANVEIKTAQRSRGRWQFTLRVPNHTDIDGADLVLLQAVDDSARVFRFLIPVSEIPREQKSINLTSLSNSKYAKWRVYESA